MSEKANVPDTTFNDLWILMRKVTTSEYALIPDRFKKFVQDNMIPDYESKISPYGPVDWSLVTSNAGTFMISLYVTYLAKGPSDRRKTSEGLYHNEHGSEVEMSEEDYQSFLESFDDWNVIFGAIPYWGESRGWCPESCYEITEDMEEADLRTHDLGLKMAVLTPEERNTVVEEAREWTLVKTTEYETTLYWHDDDHSEGKSFSEDDDFYRKQVVVKDGHFAGVILKTSLTGGMGMSTYNDEEIGILFTDGTSNGRNHDHYSRSSDESSYSETTYYELKKKTAEE